MYGDGGVEPDPYRGHEFPEIRNVPADTHPHDSVRLSSLLGGVCGTMSTSMFRSIWRRPLDPY